MSWFHTRKAGLAAALAFWLVAGGVLVGRCQAESKIDFINDVMPLLDKLGCSQCHAAGGGKGGLKLSMFGAEPEHDYAALTRSRAGRPMQFPRQGPLHPLGRGYRHFSRDCCDSVAGTGRGCDDGDRRLR